MVDRQTDKNFVDFLDENVEVILNNQMHYTGKVISVGNIFLKLNSMRGETVFIVLSMICSIVEEK